MHKASCVVDQLEYNYVCTWYKLILTLWTACLAILMKVRPINFLYAHIHISLAWLNHLYIYLAI